MVLLFFLCSGLASLSPSWGPQGGVTGWWHEAQSSTIAQLQLLWQLSCVSVQYLLLLCQQAQPILSMLTDKLRWFGSRGSLEADALAGTRLLWPTLLQKQLQRAEVLCGVGSAWSQQEFRMSPGLNHQHVPHRSLNASVILECCQHAFQPKETETWNNRGLAFNVSTKAERNFQIKDTFFTPRTFPVQSMNTCFQKNGGLILSPKRITRIHCNGKD